MRLALALSVAFAGCADDAVSPTAGEPAQSRFSVVGATEQGSDVHLHFEGMPDRWLTPVDWSFYQLGIYLGGFNAQIVGVEDYPGWGDLWAELLPLPAGSTVMTMGFGWSSEGSRFQHDIVFFDPVSRISMVIFPEHDAMLTCYDRGGRVVGRDTAPGARQMVGGYGQLTVPMPGHDLEVEGPGIIRCVLDAAGGAVDDVRFRRQAAELVLACEGDLGENRVTRGKELVCTARGASASDRVEIETWSFTGTTSDGQPYTFPEDADGPVTDNPWRGTMAIGGTVRVRATVNGGEPETREVPVVVQGRDWTDSPVESTIRRAGYAEFLGNDDLPPRYPQNEHHLGTTLYTGDYIPPGQPGVLEYISDFGPNHYLAYLARVPVELDIGIVIHPELDRGSTFYRRQAVDARDVAHGAPCIQSRFDRYVELILAHEGYPSTSQSHSGVFLREYSRRAGPLVEDLVLPGDRHQQLATLYAEILDGVVAEADAVSDNVVDSQAKVSFGCTFNWGR